MSNVWMDVKEDEDLKVNILSFETLEKYLIIIILC